MSIGDNDTSDLTPMECLLNAQELLENAKHQDFERVILFGLKKGKIVIRQSSGCGRLETMGALFASMMEVWGQIENHDGDTED